MPVTLTRLDVAQTLTRAIGAGESRRFDAIGAWGSGKAMLAAQVADALNRPLLIIAPNRIDADAIFDDLTTFSGEGRAALLPAWEVLPNDAMAPADDIVAERLNTLEALARAFDEGETKHIVAPVRSILQRVVRRTYLAGNTITLTIGDTHDLESLITQFSAMGYEREVMVEQRGHMSVRGGIFDIFPISSELPFRIEFFGDEIESIRRFEPETQRSIDQQEFVRILPRSEKSMLEQERERGLASILEYFPSNTLIVLEEPKAIAEEASRLDEQFPDNPYLMRWPDLHEAMQPYVQIGVAQLPFPSAPDTKRINAPMSSISGWRGNIDGFWSQLQLWDQEGYTVFLLCNNNGERHRLYELLEERGYDLARDRFDLHVELGRLRSGFVSHTDKLAILSEREMFGRHYTRRARRRFEAGEALRAYSDLKSGDFVVHAVHGIGRYFGLKKFSGKAGDFLAIQYSDGDKIYIPVTAIDTVQKYAAGEGSMPKIDRLGGASWQRTKAKVKKKLKDMTEELIKLYAEREARGGYAYPQDTPWQNEFEDAFEYDETPDQERAIIDVKADMESPRPMDRLVCGDVGFGKTEVALRAGFKCAVDGRQVAILVPTTVLAEQHYNNFMERVADYPIKVEMLSRFRSPKEVKSTIERIASGDVDIVVGTHRIISKDIKFKNLGLLIIDEEQKFGVAQKEAVKKMKTQVDVLTLTATPIPRTLNLALSGIRDMSVINTAPNDRLPVHTCIEAFDERLIQEAICRELARAGQVFFVHNRVHNILEFAQLIQELVPHARIGVGHGQMNEHELEHVMMGFVRKDIDVLVCTTIIGSGIDIPNANTIIINNADHFGLAELYQLRGRVGRYKHRAFAYLLVPGDRVITEEAQKRLKALEEFSTLGSGLRIAMRDMEIRGCGNLLGGEQHGCILAVGYETYAHLLQEAVAEIRGQAPRIALLPAFEAAVDASIPDGYIADEAQKIALYKRIAAVRTVEEVDEMQQEVADRFGKVPQQILTLLDVMRVRARGAEAGAKRIVGATYSLVVEFESQHALTTRVCTVLAQQFGERLNFKFGEQPSITYTFAETGENAVLRAADQLVRALIEAHEAVA